MQPNDYRPVTPDELLGKPSMLAASIMHRITELKHEPGSRLKLLMHGSPGNGKSTIAKMIARALVNERSDIESTIGGDLKVDMVREWQRNLCYNSLWGGWRVKVIDEVDLVVFEAENSMLKLLDDLPEKWAIIATSNGPAEKMKERYRTRFQYVSVPSPSQDEIAAWLAAKWGAATKIANWIAAGCCGNVRDALNQYSTYITTGELQCGIGKKPSPTQWAAKHPYLARRAAESKVAA